jgi:hypothetical protein
MVQIDPVNEINTMSNERQHTKGRGSNPASRSNLIAGPQKNYWVMVRNGVGGWTELAGPMTRHSAVSAVTRLERYNDTQHRPMYLATSLQSN